MRLPNGKQKNFKVFYVCGRPLCKWLISMDFCFASELGDLLRGPSPLGSAPVKQQLSTKLSTACVDSFKSAYESGGYAIS